MRALLSSVGTRGDVQPIVALALRVRDLGHEVRLCVPPNFVEWVRGLGFEAAPVGVEMRYPAAGGGSALGIGSAAVDAPTREALATALHEALESAVASRSRSVARQLRSDGAMVAAQRLIAL